MAANVCDENRLNTKLSHKQWKALIRKEKKKRRRQEAAKQRDELATRDELAQENSPSYIAKKLEEDRLERLEAEHEERQRAIKDDQWQRREKQAQGWWRLKQEAEVKEKQRRLDEEKRIREEWEEKQKKEKAEAEDRKKQDETKKAKQDELLKEATAKKKKNDGPWHNPLAPSGGEPGKQQNICPFFAKVAACRFAERCSRAHPDPGITNTLLIPGMFARFELEQGFRDEYDTDLWLEFEDTEVHGHFLEFYNDVLPEFKNIGKVIQFKVCCNYEKHLRGNVYIQFQRDEDAQKAMVSFNGRWYAGRQISCQFVDIPSWRSAICGLFFTNKCQKGKACNFLHVFKNPNNEFREWDTKRFYSDLSTRRSYRSERRSRSPSRTHRRSPRSSRRSRRSRSRSVPKRHSRSPSNSKYRHRSRSRSQSRDLRRERIRSRSRSRESRSTSKRVSVRRSRSRSKGKSWNTCRSRSRSPYHKSSRRVKSRSRSRSTSRPLERRRTRSRERTRRHRRSRSWSPDISLPKGYGSRRSPSPDSPRNRWKTYAGISKRSSQLGAGVSVGDTPRKKSPEDVLDKDNISDFVSLPSDIPLPNVSTESTSDRKQSQSHSSPSVPNESFAKINKTMSVEFVNGEEQLILSTCNGGSKGRHRLKKRKKSRSKSPSSQRKEKKKHKKHKHKKHSGSDTDDIWLESTSFNAVNSQVAITTSTDVQITSLSNVHNAVALADTGVPPIPT